MMRSAALVLLATLTVCDASSAQAAANPIRKVVTMLQKMQEKVTEEGKKEQELYDKFMCYCSKGDGELSKSISEAKAKIESLTASIEASSKTLEQTKADLKEHQASQAEAEEAMSSATALREKEAAAFAKTSADLETNIAALGKAITAIEKGAAGSFLQTTEANKIRTFAMEQAEIADATRQELLSFLSGSQADGYAPQSGEITGILKTMEDEMNKSLKEATEDENSAIANYEELMAAKKKEVATLQEQIEVEMTRVGNLGVEIANMKNDQEDTTEALGQDQKFQLELEQSCKTKTAEWEEIKKVRSEELVALADTIKILNDDDALELFKKTLPSASSSFMQLTASSSAVKARALQLIRKAQKGKHSPALDLISLALSGKKIGFGKVIKMIDDMVEVLKKDQADDDAKKEYCEKMFDEAEDKKKALEQSVSDSESAIEEMKGLIETLTEEIAALKKGIKDLDASVAEATENRKAENTDYKELMANDSAAKDILMFAKNRLNKFYNPKLYKAPPKREAESFVQIRAHSQRSAGAPPPPPETFGAYKKKGEEGGGVIAMIDLLVKDLDKEMQEAEIMEKDAQSEYETMMEESGEKRAADSKSLTQKEGSKASTEGELEAETDKKKATVMDLMATEKYISELHLECDWILSNYDARKAARESESEALVSAKAVLNGADFSLIQTSSRFLAKRA